MSLTQTYRRIRFGEPVIVVSGLPRSGTSMAMKMLEAAGLPLVVDNVRTADEDNPRGYFEDERVKNLGDGADRAWLKDGRGKVVKVISYLLKDLPASNNYSVIFLRRNLQEVLASQRKMLDHRGEPSATPDEKMIEIYQDHLWKVGYLFKHGAHLRAIDIDYKAVVEDPRSQAVRIRQFLGRDLDVERMAAAVDPNLYRNRR